MTDKRHLTPKETANRLRTSTSTLAGWRTQGKGPRYMKLGHLVLYPLDEIVKFENDALRQSTTEGVK